MKIYIEKQKYKKFDYEGTAIYVGNQDTLAIHTKDMVVPFTTGKREAEMTLTYSEKGKTLYGVPVEYVLACIKYANAKFEGKGVQA